MKKYGIMLTAAVLALPILLLTGCGVSGGKGGTTEVTPQSNVSESSTVATETVGKDEMKITPKITISDGKFMVGENELFINGVNTPWENWNDFGGSFNASFWNSHFKDLHEIGVNASRVWINCNSMVGIKLRSDGTVGAVTEKHWKDIDSLFKIAEKNQIYLMPTLLSFDHFKSPDSAALWRLVVTDDTARASFIDKYIIPFTERYGDSPYLFGIDLMNEPDWVHENEECGQLPLSALSKFFAECTAAIHKTNPETLVTVGVGIIKYNSDKYEGNIISDSVMKRYGGDDACVDFYSTHYYEWMKPWFGVPYEMSPAAFGLDTGKPSIIGEITADSSENLVGIYEKCYKHGWCGVMEWASNNVSGHAANWNDIAAAAGRIMELIPDRVFPLGKK